MIASVVCAAAVCAAVLTARPSRGRLRRGLFRAVRARASPRSGDGLAAAVPALSVPALLDLVAEVMASGASAPRAVAAVAECLDHVRDPTARHLARLAAELQGTARPWMPLRRAPDIRAASAGPDDAVAALTAALALSVATGAGPVVLIRAAAEEHRRRSEVELTRAAQRLGVLVLLPTGLCLLPAFVLLTIAPLVIDLVLG